MSSRQWRIPSRTSYRGVRDLPGYPQEDAAEENEQWLPANKSFYLVDAFGNSSRQDRAAEGKKQMSYLQ